MDARKRLYILLSSLLLALALIGCSPAKLSTSELSRMNNSQPPQGQALVLTVIGKIRHDFPTTEKGRASTALPPTVL